MAMAQDLKLLLALLALFAAFSVAHVLRWGHAHYLLQPRETLAKVARHFGRETGIPFERVVLLLVSAAVLALIASCIAASGAAQALQATKKKTTQTGVAGDFTDKQI